MAARKQVLKKAKAQRVATLKEEPTPAPIKAPPNNGATTESNTKSKKDYAWLQPYKWPKGFCPNPKGAARTKPITERYLNTLEVQLPANIRTRLGLEDKHATVGDAIALSMAVQAMTGSLAATQEITNRVEGTVSQKMEHSNPDGMMQPIQFNVLFVSSDGNGSKQ